MAFRHFAILPLFRRVRTMKEQKSLYIYGFFSNVSLFAFYHFFPHLKFLLEPTIYNQEAILKVAIIELKQKSSTNKCKEVVKNNFTNLGI